MATSGGVVRRLAPRFGAAVAALMLLGAAVAALLARPPSYPNPGAAVRAHVASLARASTIRVIGPVPWGDGAVVAAAYDARSGRRLTVAFVRHGPRGWHVAEAATQAGEITDVTVGSLLVTSSRGGPGVPRWTAVYGEVGDARIAKVEIRWLDGPPAAVTVTDGVYLVVRGGGTVPVDARFLGSDGVEIAVVPVA